MYTYITVYNVHCTLYSVHCKMYIVYRGSLRLPTLSNTDPSRISITIRDIKKLYIH